MPTPAAIGGILIAIAIILIIILLVIGAIMGLNNGEEWGKGVFAGSIIGAVAFGLGIGGMYMIYGPTALIGETAGLAGALLGRGEDDYDGSPIETVKDCGCSGGDDLDDVEHYLNDEIRGAHEKDMLEKFEDMVRMLKTPESGEQIDELISSVETLKDNAVGDFNGLVEFIDNNGNEIIEMYNQSEADTKDRIKRILNHMSDLADEAEDKSEQIKSKLHELKEKLSD